VLSQDYPYRYPCLSVILRRFLGWSYRMWVVGQYMIVAERRMALPAVTLKRHRRGR